MKQSTFPSGWDEERVKRVLAHYTSQSEKEAVAEDNAAFETRGKTLMEVPANIVLLFDEQGTPTFRPDRETVSFLGIGVVYGLANEEHLFRECDQWFGLSNSRPLKNNKIRNSRAERISKLIANLPIQVTITSIDLSSEELQQVVGVYEELGNIMRAKHRKVRERPTPQILHSDILDYTLFESITRYIKNSTTNSSISVYIDDWSIPANDLEIALEMRSQSLEEKINDLFGEFVDNLAITVSPIVLLNQDSSRKRFVDVISSVVSRSFLKEDNPRFSNIPLQNILDAENSHNESHDITDNTIRLMRKSMDEFLRNS